MYVFCTWFKFSPKHHSVYIDLDSWWYVCTECFLFFSTGMTYSNTRSTSFRTPILSSNLAQNAPSIRSVTTLVASIKLHGIEPLHQLYCYFQAFTSNSDSNSWPPNEASEGFSPCEKNRKKPYEVTVSVHVNKWFQFNNFPSKILAH